MFDPQPIRDRLSQASPGPWQRHGADVHGAGTRLFTGRDGSAEVRAQADRDAEFVAHARADVQQLLEELARLQEQLRSGSARADDGAGARAGGSRGAHRRPGPGG